MSGDQSGQSLLGLQWYTDRRWTNRQSVRGYILRMKAQLRDSRVPCSMPPKRGWVEHPELRRLERKDTCPYQSGDFCIPRVLAGNAGATFRGLVLVRPSPRD